MKKNRFDCVKYSAKIDSDRNSFHAARKFLAECAGKSDISPHKFAVLELMITEHLENIYRHGYRGKKGIVEITMSVKGPEIYVKVKDAGPAFNMMNKKIPDTAKRIKKGLGGKMGIKIMRELSDRVTYRRVGGHNINIFIVKSA